MAEKEKHRHIRGRDCGSLGGREVRLSYLRIHRPGQHDRPVRIYDRFSLENFPNCFKEYADLLAWYEYWHTTLDTSDAPCFKWFVGGKINASYNCVDRHLAKNRNKTAIHFAPEPIDEKYEHITYQELYVRVNEFAALLRDFAGLKKGDRVTLHMPMVPELPITMLACARLGVIHSQVFGGFSGRPAPTGLSDSQSRVLITMDAYWRSGTLIDHKQNADIACDLAAKDGQKVDKVLVWQRYPGQGLQPDPHGQGPRSLRERGTQKVSTGRGSSRNACRPRRRSS